VATYLPTQSVVEHLRVKGMLNRWGDIVQELERATVAPAQDHDTRLRLVAPHYEAFVDPTEHDGLRAFLVVYLKERRDVVAVPRQRQVVGREAPRRRYGKSYGSGRRWPTTWAELKERLRAHPDVTLEMGGKHLSVLLKGRAVYTMPLTSSDHRALLNACQSLRQAGIDVRR